MPSTITNSMSTLWSSRRPWSAREPMRRCAHHRRAPAARLHRSSAAAATSPSSFPTKSSRNPNASRAEKKKKPTRSKKPKAGKNPPKRAPKILPDTEVIPHSPEQLIFLWARKSIPIGFRLAVTKDWRSKWFASKQEFRGKPPQRSSRFAAI